MINIELLVIGGGPAGLSAGIAAGKCGVKTIVVDENPLPGGQLFKQIHKFFGSKEHKAGTRGYKIGEQLLNEVDQDGVEVYLNTRVWGIFDNNIVGILKDGKTQKVKAQKIILATGASENAIAFKGSTLPGIMTAGAAQTFINVHRVLPGKKILMIGTGNVGLITSYQLMQAGAEVVGVVEASQNVGGYDVHANKLRRAGIPIYLGHTVIEAKGDIEVDGAIIAPVDEKFKVDKSKSFLIDCDTICFAVGLTPRIELAQMVNAPIIYMSTLGGYLPIHDNRLKITEDIFIAGDISGVEEASTAMEEGSLAGVAVAMELGKLDKNKGVKEIEEIYKRLAKLRSGQFGSKRASAKEEIIKKQMEMKGGFK
ncbi:MAG: NAD(P)/FAD-dependent oxidoreductase [Firmicutes bacterium]|nr:NAD(P)/FAD-dependent oxidoreductase [Bacillota bacterium]